MRSAVIKIFFIIFLAAHTSCHRQQGERIAQNNPKDVVSTVPASNTENRIAQKQDTISKAEEFTDELEGNDELISPVLFKKWIGTYLIKDIGTDAWDRESISKTEVNLIKPDSCIFRFWLEDTEGRRYEKDDNYTEIQGVILPTLNRDSIEFITKKILSGNGNQSISPLLSITKEGENYFIYSIITSPPHNGLVKMPIQKVEK